MDLYRVLRISIYLLVASGAFADSVAEENAVFLVGVVAFGALAYFTVDARRWKPVRLEFACAMALALLVYTLLPLRDEGGWDHFPAALAHFLCALQVLLFFTPFRGPLLLLYCGATLGVVVLSGVIKSDISLVGRLICFVTIVSWTLFIHSLWRAREAFNARSGAGASASEARSPDRVLSERVFWQELAMTGGMSAVCMVLGVLLYVFAPRVNEGVGKLLGLMMPRMEEKTTDAGDDPGGIPGPLDDGSRESVGPSNRLPFTALYPLRKDPSPALQIKFSPLPKELASAEGRLLLKAAAVSEYDGGWVAPRAVSAPKEPQKSIADPSLGGAVYKKGAEFKETIHHYSRAIHEYTAAGNLQRVDAKIVEQDEEGTVTAPKGEPFDHAELWATVPPRASDVPDATLAVHENVDRYMFNTKIPGPDARLKELKELARQVAANKKTDKQKVQAIVAYLRDPKNFSYTLRIDELKQGKDEDAIERFLLNHDPAQRRGHCVYFATAFVLLCRWNNVPARLVRGFSVDFPTIGPDGDASVTILNSDAHAWGEVYFKGIGWVAFDPTPHEAAPPEPGPTAVATTPIPPAAGSARRDSNGALDDAWTRFIHLNSSRQPDVYEWIKDGVSATTTVLGGSSTLGWAGALIAWLLVIVLLSAMVFAFLRRGGTRLSLSGSGVRRTRAAVAFYNDLLSVLSRRGYVRRPGQTPREFAELVVKRGGADFQPVMTVTEIFESVRYGNVDVSQDDFNALQKSLDRLKELTFGAR